jgi:hypothetical protein
MSEKCPRCGASKPKALRPNGGCFPDDHDPWHSAPSAAAGAEQSPQPQDWRNMCIVEIAAENLSVSDYMQHWEDRTLTAEKRVAALEEALKRVKTTFFYVRNLSHDAWRDPPNLEAVCKRIEQYAKMEYDLLEALLAGKDKR